MHRFFYLILFFLSIFSLSAKELNVTWNEKVYGIESKDGTFKYNRVSEIEYNATITIFADYEPFADIENSVFRLYYNDDKMVLQKTILISDCYKPEYQSIAVECKIKAKKEFLEKMQKDDTLYYKCSFELPNGEIYESKPIKAKFVLKWGLSGPVGDFKSLKYYNAKVFLQSDDNEYYKLYNYRKDGYIDYNPDNFEKNRMTVIVTFENILPGKSYSLTINNSVQIEGIPFHILLDL